MLIFLGFAAALLLLGCGTSSDPEVSFGAEDLEIDTVVVHEELAKCFTAAGFYSEIDPGDGSVFTPGVDETTAAAFDAASSECREELLERGIFPDYSEVPRRELVHAVYDSLLEDVDCLKALELPVEDAPPFEVFFESARREDPNGWDPFSLVMAGDDQEALTAASDGCTG